jgi:Flp pilus assembly protein TadD
MLQSMRNNAALPMLFLSLGLGGCAGLGSRHAIADNGSNAINPSKIGLAARAQQALLSGDTATGIALAEEAAEYRPGEAGFRGFLGNAYLSAGRFASAEAAFRDTLTLSPNQTGIALKLVLAVIAQGHNAEALRLIDQYRGSLDAADAGLAMALSGQPGNGIAVLDEAARTPEADARVRQNLALAHALAGDWAQARAIAAQDVPADQIDARLAQWMGFARPGQALHQVASLIGVAPAASDPGQPVRLALSSSSARLAANPADRMLQSVAAAVPQPLPVQLAQAPAAASVASAEPAMPEAYVPPPSVAAPKFAVAPPVAADPLRPALAEAAPQPLLPAVTIDSIRREPVRLSGQLPHASELRRAAALRFASGGRSVVQLGAYGSPQSVQAAWSKVLARHPGLSRFAPASARFASASGMVYRLSVGGFGSDREARTLCQSLQNKGSACFVRSLAGDQTVKFAQR